MRLQSVALAATLVLTLAACGDDEPALPTTPVTLKFVTSVYNTIPGTANDTVKGFIIVDGTDTLSLPYDSITNFPRGEHEFVAHLDIDYLPSSFTVDVNPRSNTAIVEVPQAGSCRVYAANGQPIDATFCTPQGQQPRNILYWSQRRRIFCPAGDFLEYCSPFPARDGLGLTWPTDQAASSANEYVSLGKLLVAATVAPELGGTDAGRSIAMSLFHVGDFAPRRRLQVVTNDSSRYSNIAWSDVRHFPIYNFLTGQLDPDDRRSSLFGLEVKATYFMPQQQQDVLFVRYDVKNISAEPDYRNAHPQVPEAGFTLRDVYLTPVIDADVGNAFNGSTQTGEPEDDAATIFPAENLAVTWDRTFAVSFWDAPWRTAPGLVGFRFLESDAGTAKGVVFSNEAPEWKTVTEENEAHAILSAGRGPTTLSRCRNFASAYVCGPETGADARVGWSVGPIATLAPGESRQVTVAILLASPSAGTFTSGTAYAPGNTTADEVANANAKTIYTIAGALRTLSTAINGSTVTPAP